MIAPVISSPAIEALAEVVEGTGLVDPRSSGVVLVSGGADSACAAAALVAVCGPESVSGIHVNYGLRLDSDEDERAARALCAKLRIDLHVDRPELGEGNLQAEARDARYAAAERLRGRLEVSEDELQSIMRLIGSDFDITLARVLRTMG